MDQLGLISTGSSWMTQRHFVLSHDHNTGDNATCPVYTDCHQGSLPPTKNSDQLEDHSTIRSRVRKWHQQMRTLQVLA